MSDPLITPLIDKYLPDKSGIISQFSVDRKTRIAHFIIKMSPIKSLVEDKSQLTKIIFYTNRVANRVAKESSTYNV